MDNDATIVDELLGKSSVKRRKTAIHVRNSKYESLCETLVKAFLIEKFSKNWQTKVEIVKTIGLLRCSNATDLLEEIIFRSEPELDMVSKEAALAWIRITRENTNDSKPVLKILESSSYSAKEGALEALGYDRMIPDLEDCDAIIKLSWDFGHDRPKGYTDPRYGLAAACAGWNRDIVNSFLEQCLKAKDVPLLHVASNALKGKYVKLR